MFSPLAVVVTIYFNFMRIDYMELKTDETTNGVMITIIIVKILQNIASFVFIFRQKVPEKSTDSLIRFWPKFTGTMYWLTYVICPAFFIVTLIIISSTQKDINQAIQAQYVYLLLVEVGSVIWYSTHIYPQYKEKFVEWEKVDSTWGMLEDRKKVIWGDNAPENKELTAEKI